MIQGHCDCKTRNYITRKTTATTTQSLHSSSASTSSSSNEEKEDLPRDSTSNSDCTILCDLQTFLRLLDLDEIPTGGAAKMIIQGQEVLLNGKVETRRAKKLFKGDKVQFVGMEEMVFDVAAQVTLRGYVYKPKNKKKKPTTKKRNE